MNILNIIGNLTGDPETRVIENGDTVVTFTVACNRRGENAGADFVRVSAWGGCGTACAKYLSKGKKVYVSGPVRVRAWLDDNGTARASLEMTAREVEFLAPRGQEAADDE